MTNHKGQVKYTQRAFQQDASEAMKGDVLRALVELVTNADDALNEFEQEKATEIE